MAISMDELLKGADFSKLPKDIQDNMTELLVRINKVRSAYGKAMTITSGIRTKEDQLRIYKAKGVPESKIPWGSQHLKGAAVDISDPDRKLQEWVKANLKLMEEIGLWMEDFGSTPNWVHFQTVPPKSGVRIFKP